MKAILISAATIGLFAATPAFAQAGPVASDTADAKATVIAPIAVNNMTDLNFGNVIGTAAGGTVSVDVTGLLTGAAAPAGALGSAARFDVTGQSGYFYTATLPSTAVSLIGPALSSPMTATISIDGGTNTKIGTLVAGADSVYVIGSLAVGANQAPGAYLGSFSLNVQYN